MTGKRLEVLGLITRLRIKMNLYGQEVIEGISSIKEGFSDSLRISVYKK